MSEDDFSRGDSSSAVPHIPGKHRGPRFTWNPAFEVTFFRSLCESVQLGLREGMTFKAEAWDRAAQALIDRHNAYANKGHLINKSDNARKKYRLWRGLREHPDFLYNPTTKTVTGSEEAWRRHIEKEPLSRSLKGRPFEYEDYYEILFPDVIGTGGAPKRVTSRKRKGDEQDEQGTPGTAIMSLLADATYGGTTTSSPLQQQQQQPPQQAQILGQPRPTSGAPSGAPAPSPAGAQQQPRPTSAVIPPRTSITSTSALTPPEESAPHTRQRFLAPQDQQQQNTQQSSRNAAGGSVDKRRRTDHLNVQAPPLAGVVAAQQQQQSSSHPLQSHDGILALAEALRSAKSARPGWSEQALDVFFRDFGEEDMDLQIKIAEKALAADENKAMVFCKMPVVLRKHWVKRLREVHNGHNRT